MAGEGTDTDILCCSKVILVCSQLGCPGIFETNLLVCTTGMKPAIHPQAEVEKYLRRLRTRHYIHWLQGKAATFTRSRLWPRSDWSHWGPPFPFCVGFPLKERHDKQNQATRIPGSAKRETQFSLAQVSFPCTPLPPTSMLSRSDVTSEANMGMFPQASSMGSPSNF